ncbi:MAG: hypothetical protein ACK5JF_01780 [Oscillospiraceae bacterium]
MRKAGSVQKMTAAALLMALGMIIPMFSPLKIVLEPASFTLASHVPLFLSMFISPWVSIAVSLGTTAGFFLAGAFPPVVVLRAASHIIFVIIGSFWLQRHSSVLSSYARLTAFSFVIALIHALCETVVSSIFYMGGLMSTANYNHGFLWSVLLLVGGGSIVHSMFDFAIALLILQALAKQKSTHSLFANSPYTIKSI